MPGGFDTDVSLCGAVSASPFTSSSLGITVTADLSANSKGSWVPFITSLAADAGMMIFNPQKASNSETFSVDIGVGGTGSEVVVFGDIPYFSSPSSVNGLYLPIPCSFPSGSQVSMRCSCGAFGGFTFSANLVFLSGSFGFGTIAGCELIGTASPVESGTANVKGSYSQIVATTTRNYKGILLAVAPGTSSENQIVYDLAIGGSGSEIVILPNFATQTNNFSNWNATPQNTGYLPIQIAAGSRLAARVQCDQTTAGAQQVSVIGFF